MTKHNRKPRRRLNDTIVEKLTRQHRIAYTSTPRVLTTPYEESCAETRGLRIVVQPTGHGSWGYRGPGIPFKKIGEYPVMKTDDARLVALALRRGEALPTGSAAVPAPAPSRSTIPDTPFNAVVRLFQDFQFKRAAVGQISPNTSDSYIATISVIGQHFGARPFLSVGTRAQTDYIEQVALTRKTKASVDILVALATFAVDKQFAPKGWAHEIKDALARALTAPVNDTTPAEADVNRKYQRRVVRRRAMLPIELSVLWEAAGALPAAMSDYGKVIRLLLLNPCRVEEIAGLRRSEIQTSTVELTGAEQRGVLIGGNTKLVIPLNASDADRIEVRRVNRRNKNGSAAFWLPLAPESLRIIDAQSEYPPNAKLQGRDSYVFKFTPANTQQALIKFLPYVEAEWERRKRDGKVTGEMKPWDHHCLRHTFSTHVRSFHKEAPANLDNVAEALQNHRPKSKEGEAETYNAYAYAEEKAVVLALWEQFVLAPPPRGEVVGFRREKAA